LESRSASLPLSSLEKPARGIPVLYFEDAAAPAKRVDRSPLEEAVADFFGPAEAAINSALVAERFGEGSLSIEMRSPFEAEVTFEPVRAPVGTASEREQQPPNPPRHRHAAVSMFIRCLRE
jgi:hypothetical protein